MEKSKKKISSKFLRSPEILNRYFIDNQNNETIFPSYLYLNFWMTRTMVWQGKIVDRIPKTFRKIVDP